MSTMDYEQAISNITINTLSQDVQQLRAALARIAALTDGKIKKEAESALAESARLVGDPADLFGVSATAIWEQSPRA